MGAGRARRARLEEEAEPEHFLFEGLEGCGGSSRLDDDDHVAARREEGLVATEDVAQAALEEVAHGGLADLAADCEA